MILDHPGISNVSLKYRFKIGIGWHWHRLSSVAEVAGWASTSPGIDTGAMENDGIVVPGCAIVIEVVDNTFVPEIVGEKPSNTIKNHQTQV